MKQLPFRKDDQEAVLQYVGPIIPALLREAVDEGFYNHCQSKELDIEGFVDYMVSTRSGMLYDRMAAALRNLIDIASEEHKELRCQITANHRSTEVMYDPYFAFRIKRARDSRGGLTANVKTKRQQAIKSGTELSPGQMVLQYPNANDSLPDEERLWLTVTFDLDSTEDMLTKVFMGIETEKHFLWKAPLFQNEPNVIASLPALLADRIIEMQQRRLA